MTRLSSSALAALALMVAGCATSELATGSASLAPEPSVAEVTEANDSTEGVEPPGEAAPTQDPEPTPDTAPPASDDSGEPDRSRGTRSVDDDDAGGDGDGDADAAEVSGSPSELIDDALPLAGTIAEFLRAWDDTNRRIFEADSPFFQRVAAELEQVSAVASDGGQQLFWAQLSDGGLVGGATNAEGLVNTVVVVAGVDDERDRVVALTTLALFFGDERQLGLATENYQEVLEGDVGESEVVVEGDLVAVIDRRDIAGGSVSILVARGISPELAELSADGLVELLAQLAGSNE